MAACLTALVSHSPAQAFSSAFQGIANVVNPGTATVSQNPGVDVITVTAPQAVINWTPNDRGSSGTIDFLPFGSIGRFIGTQEFTVLNRIIPLDGNDLPIARLIALNGTIESQIINPLTGAATRGGSVWFYSPGGILVGSGATINVGSLVLSTRDIDTSGGLFGPGGDIRFRDTGIAGTAGSTITIAPGAQIFASRASGANSYIAMVAPRIEQRGVVQADGSVGLIAAERADVRINAGLFDINVLVGTEDNQGIVHTGTTGGILDAPDGHTAYLVAVPKNQMMTMLLSGVIGYVPGQAAGVNAQGNIVISAGRNASGTMVGAVVGGNNTGSVNIQDSIFLNDLVVGATNQIDVRPLGDCAPMCSPFGTFGQVQFRGNATMTADQLLRMSIGNAQRIVADQNLTLRAGTAGQGGMVALSIDNAPPSSPSSSGGGVMMVTGNLLIDASAVGQTAVDNGIARGGSASISILNGELNASSITVRSNATGGVNVAGDGASGIAGMASVSAGTNGLINTSVLRVEANGQGAGQFLENGGEGIGGSASVSASDGGIIIASQLLSLQAIGSGILGNTRSGNGTGGVAEIIVGSGQSSIVAGQTEINASGYAGEDQGNLNLSSSPQTTIGGGGAGGTVRISSAGDANLGTLSIFADGIGGPTFETGSVEIGGDGQGGGISIDITGGNTRVSDLFASAIGVAGTSGSPNGSTGSANGGAFNLRVRDGGTLANRGDAFIDVRARIDTSGGGSVRAATGGSILIAGFNGGVISSTGTWNLLADANSELDRSASAVPSAEQASGGSITISAVDNSQINIGNVNASASAIGAHTTTVGGAARGGFVDLLVNNGGTIVFDETGSNFAADAIAGSGMTGGEGTGGTVNILVDGGTIDLDDFTSFSANGSGGQSFDGMTRGVGQGGNIFLSVTGNSASTLLFDNLSLFSIGSTAIGGEGFINLGSGATSRGGNINLQFDGGTVSGDLLSVDASGSGDGNADSLGGAIAWEQTGGNVDINFIDLSANGIVHNNLFSAAAGNGYGGQIRIRQIGGTLTTDNFSASAQGRGGDGVSFSTNFDFSGGEGGNGGGQSFDIYGGLSPDNVQFPSAPTNGGDGFGGTIDFSIGGDATINTRFAFGIQLDASGIGGEGGSAVIDSFTERLQPGNGGNGRGGTINFEYESGSFNGGSGVTPGISLAARGIGGEGGSLFVGCPSFCDENFTLPTDVTGARGGSGEGGSVNVLLTGALGGIEASLDSSGFGGRGGSDIAGGSGGEGRGGDSRIVVSDVDAGTASYQLISRGRGGDGGFGIHGGGGNGGEGQGGVAALVLSGIDAAIATDNIDFIVTGRGGSGGNAFVSPFAATAPMMGGNGGNGGGGFGGTIDIEVLNANLLLGMAGEGADFESRGIGGNAGNGADNSAGPSGEARFGGNAGFGGAGFGGTVNLRAIGGSIAVFQNRDLNVNVAGTGGEGGVGGSGNTITLFDMMGNPIGTSGGSGFSTGRSFNGAGIIRLEANDDGENLGRISLNDAFFEASGDIGGRIELIDNSAGAGLEFGSLDARAFGGAVVGDDFASIGSGIYIRTSNNPIFIHGPVTLMTDGSVQIDAHDTGGLIVDDILTVSAGRDFVVRHVDRDPSLRTISSRFINAFAGSIDLQPGSRISAGQGMRLESLSSIRFDILSNGSNDIDLIANGRIEGVEVNSSDGFLAESNQGDIAIDDIEADSRISLIARNGNVSGDVAVSDIGSIFIDADSVNYGSIFAGGEGGIRILAAGNVTLDSAVTRAEDVNQESGLPTGVQGQLAVTPGDYDIFISAGGNVSFNEIEAFDSLFITAASISAAGSIASANAGISINTTGNAELGELETSFGDMDIRAGDLLTADLVRIGSSGAEGIFRGTNGVTIDTVRIPGTSSFTATNGAVLVSDLVGGLVTALGRTVELTATGTVTIDSVEATAGNATLVGASGNLTVNTGRASDTFAATTNSGALSVNRIDATTIALTSQSSTVTMTGPVTASGLLDVASRRATTVNGVAVGRNIEIDSGDLVIGTNGRIGALGATQTMLLNNSDSAARTFIGGNDQPGEYSISSAEMARLFGNDITIRAPRVSAQGGGAVGLTRPPDVVIGAFTFVGGGGTGANLGSSGTLRIETPGFARVVGAAQFNTMSATNGFELDARESIEVILGQGSIRLTGSGANSLGGTLSLFSDDIVVATSTAITAIAGLTDLSAIDERLAQNDGITDNDGALTANAIDLFVTNGVYIQNSGLSDKFADRRGFTTNSLGINFAGSPASGNPNLRIVINGRIGDASNVLLTGIDAIALAVINGSAGGLSGGFDPLSTINGCLIANPAPCSTPEIIFTDPIRDVIEEEVEEDEDSSGEGSQYQSLITIRENDRTRDDPLLDEPITGSGNDDLWVPAE